MLRTLLPTNWSQISEEIPSLLVIISHKKWDGGEDMIGEKGGGSQIFITCNLLYLNRFPIALQQKIQEWLLIIRQDLHLDNPYLMAEVTTTAKFLLSGSAFQSFLSPAADIA